MPTISVAVLSLLSGALGAAVGVVLGHVLAQRRSRKDSLDGFRLKAYADFISAASQLVAARRMGSTSDLISDLAVLNDAKVRICMCADVYVVEALVDFWRLGGTLEKEEEILAFTRLCQRIRESIGNERNDTAFLDISSTLFRLEPSSYSYRSAKSL
ncbi:hypothetical protein [Dyella sp. C11]|uniref:hypothetical protein n=1 Tax=Dyella sp. C11 TaxID=2126991 RepID=UPI0013002432|nr:hypothetical protein [Dyella sp. C11]